MAFDPFSIFTGAPAQEAGTNTRNYLSGVQNTGNIAIDTGVSGASGALTGGYNTATGAVNTGYNDAQNYYGQAAGAYQPLSALGSKYGGATTLGLDALGVNGAAGNTNAVNAFQASPGYQWQLDQGLNSINRAQNARGMANSGNTDIDALKYGQGLANQEYGSWRNSLLGFTNPELAATSGAASGQAGVYGRQADAATQRGTMLSELASRYSTNQAALDTGAASQKVGLAQSIASPYSQTYGNEAAAEMGGAGNLWNLGLNAAKLGTNVYGYSNGYTPRSAT